MPRIHLKDGEQGQNTPPPVLQTPKIPVLAATRPCCSPTCSISLNAAKHPDGSLGRHITRKKVKKNQKKLDYQFFCMYSCTYKESTYE